MTIKIGDRIRLTGSWGSAIKPINGQIVRVTRLAEHGGVYFTEEGSEWWALEGGLLWGYEPYDRAAELRQRITERRAEIEWLTEELVAAETELYEIEVGER